MKIAEKKGNRVIAAFGSGLLKHENIFIITFGGVMDTKWIIFTAAGIIAMSGTAFAKETIDISIAPAVPIPAPLMMLGAATGLIAILKNKIFK